jgi:ABC-2 type transport system ATP-binding protein
MRQRICLAQALLNDSDLLILDEVTGGLDPLGRLDIRRIIERCRAQGKTVFMSSHELSEIELVCDRIAVLARGRLLAEGPTASFLEKHARLEQYFVDLVTNPAPAAARQEGTPA